MNSHIRGMIRRDMPEVLDIERESFANPWSEDEFFRCLRQRNYNGMVAERDELVVGFMVYELAKTRLHVLDFAVAADFRRQGVGRAMVERMVWKLSQQGRTRITLEVADKNLGAQLFFRAVGFRAVSVLRDYYDGGGDAYQMVLRYHVPAEAMV